MTLPALHIEGLWWRYPSFSDQPNPWTLRDIALSVEQGECLGITGPSGSGKTTLCRTLMGILPHSARLTPEQLPHHFRGTIEALGESVTATTASTNRIGMVLQDPENQFLRMSLLHELALGLQFQNVPNDEILARSYAALSWVGLEHLWQGAAYVHPADLSGGQKQRVAIAAFLALRPQILILDEPTSDLDPVGKREVIETLHRLRRDYRMTIILVEHDPEILSAFCDRIALLHEGRIELLASPASFYNERTLLEQTGVSVGELTRISWLTGYTYQSRPPLNLPEAEIAFSPALNGLPAQLPSAGSHHDGDALPEIVVKAQDIRYRDENGAIALKGIDLDLYRGELLALLGPNGSGKTTFARIVAGLFRSTSGRIFVDGKDLANWRVRKQLPGTVGYVFQNPDHQLFCRKVRDEIEYGLKNLGIDAGRRKSTVASTLETVNLAQFADEDPLFLSKGQRQRLAVAAVLAMGPNILIIDEPTTGQDARSIASIMGILRNLQQQGKTILIITHDMTLVAEHCQRVVSFRDGQVVFTGTPAQLFTDQHALTITGLYPPASAALTLHVRDHQPDLPPLITVEQWAATLNISHTPAHP